MAQPHLTPRLHRTEEAITVLFCLVDAYDALLDPRRRRALRLAQAPLGLGGLEMVFETPEDYLNFWFPDQNPTYDDLPPDLADYYRYVLEKSYRAAPGSPPSPAVDLLRVPPGRGLLRRFPTWGRRRGWRRDRR
jgi:hypothetical protein